MPQTWLNALKKYKYPKELYKLSSDVSDLSNAFFLPKDYTGERCATIDFESYFRKQAPSNPKVWHEVALWKLYSQLNSPRRIGWERIRDIRKNVSTQDDAKCLWQIVQRFTAQTTGEEDKKDALKELMQKLGFKDRIAVTITFIAFAAPNFYPMIDTKVGDWINCNYSNYQFTDMLLQPFETIKFVDRNGKRERKYTTIAISDFKAYLKWALWCREIARLLSSMVPIEFGWRARDVEMAVFTAQDKGLKLNPIS